MAYDGRNDRDSAIANYERYADRLVPEALNTPRDTGSSSAGGRTRTRSCSRR